MYFLTLIVAIAIIVRIIIIQSDDGLKEKGNETNIRVTTVEANRGDVLAQDGRVLASSVPYYNIFIDTKTISDELWNKDISGLSTNLARILGVRSANEWRQVLEKARKEGKRYMSIAKRVDYDTMMRLKQSPIFNQGQNRGGFIAEVENRRVLMNGDLAARTIGYVNEQSDLSVGIEGAFNDYMKGSDGIVVKQRLTGGDWITIDEAGSVPSVNGDDVITTIDIDLQDVAAQALRNQLITHNADHGCAVVMEVSTGDIRAIVNLSRGSNGNYTESYNYAIGASTEPGSTFKLPVLMAALEDGLIDTAEIIDTKNGVVTYYNKAVRDSKAGGYGKITVKQVFEKSSNVGTSLIITNCYKDNPQAFVNRLYSFGLNEKNGISLAGEGEPIIRYPGDKLWSGLSLPQMSYGYEVQMTPLQILTFYNAVANDGKMMKPRFVSAISRNGKVIKQFPSEVIKERIASTETINKAKSMMEGVVERGTGTNLRAADYKIAGKTGTAQIANDNKGYKTTSRMLYQASFVGYFPADKPLYSCIVVVSAPSNGVYYGNVVAGSVFKEISDKLYATHFYKDQQHDQVNYAVAPAGGYVDDVNTVLKKISAKYNKVQESDWVTTSFANDTVTLSPVSLLSECVPDVRGMTLRDAIYLLESSGYRVRYSGRGRVRKQSPAQGSKFYTGQIVSIELGV